MFKKIILVLAFFTIILLVGKTAYCVSLDLTPNQINEAIEYGKKNKRLSPTNFAEPWVVHLDDEKSGWATLWTPYHNVAFKAKKATVEKRELSEGEILRALHFKESLTFVVSVFGEYMEFAKGYNAILYSEDKPIYPMYSFLPDYAEPSRFYPEIPAYVAGCVYKFPVENLNQSSALKLLITSPDGKELEFPFDLVKIK
ncbi:MAG: hypothetical protein HON76_07475 [Candidatus Scalindua sp.]|jgi:hypothetical protein|nr:hypothetical protein [Candidatus Scalindua sp.]MBT5304125.1 hypothetical protein [Candidatus Scalindua sp.]MBT6229575.1 hypothetical protein [Candidatus Scalindua sp.]MBT6562350.1 hypothetical protein [Candidatus Scalindua sp.]MBT7211354.1 hypothetical protein [Candidatus Scalindua sp.]